MFVRLFSCNMQYLLGVRFGAAHFSERSDWSITPNLREINRSVNQSNLIGLIGQLIPCAHVLKLLSIPVVPRRLQSKKHENFFLIEAVVMNMMEHNLFFINNLLKPLRPHLTPPRPFLTPPCCFLLVQEHLLSIAGCVYKTTCTRHVSHQACKYEYEYMLQSRSSGVLASHFFGATLWGNPGYSFLEQDGTGVFIGPLAKKARFFKKF